MSRNRKEEAGFLRVSEEFGIPASEVSRAVRSYFDTMLADSRKLPFNNRKKIYSRELFEEYVSVTNIPYIGRLGPVYSRYLKWRENESKSLPQRPRRDYRKRMTQDDIENIAEAVLSGNPVPVKRRNWHDLYERIWIVGKDTKKLARQVIPKDKQ